MKRAIFLMWILLLVVGCGGDTASANPQTADGQESVTLSVSGAFALFPMMTVWTEAYSAQNPHVKFDVQGGGAGKGMTDMLTGAADIAMLSRDPRPEELTQGAYLVPVAIDAVVGMANAQNPHLAELQAHGLTPEMAHRIWIEDGVVTWNELLPNTSAETVNVYTRSDASGAAEMWALYALAEAQEDLRGTAVNGDPGLAEAVRQDPLGVGFNNIGFAYDQTTGEPIAGLQVIPLDLDGSGTVEAEESFYANRADLMQAISAEIYPFPPARVLYLVTKGQPAPAVVDFYRWVLTDGQAYVPDAGYVALTDARIQEALTQLDE